jgi:hypothetical protein
MIHFIKEGGYKKLGLNFYRTNGGFVVTWVWYDIRNRELHGWRFRFRAHIRPWFLFSRSRDCIIDNYLFENDYVIVQKAMLEDHAPQVLAVAQFQSAQAAKDRLDRLMSV